jgi:DNA primase small subunit
MDNNRINRLNKDTSLLVFGESLTPFFWELVKGDSTVILGNAGETDEAVTVDVKRVIRHVGSLHGKCGLKVTEFPLKRLNPYDSHKFDPLSEPIVFKGENLTKLRLTVDDVTVSLNDVEINGDTGDIVEVNESLSMFLTLKDWAELVR